MRLCKSSKLVALEAIQQVRGPSTQKNPSVKEKTEYPTMGILGVLKDFAVGTSIHGLWFIVNPKSSSLKRITWSFAFIAALVYATHELNLAVICNNVFFKY